MQHFLKSARARTLSAAEVFDWPETRAFEEFSKLRWPDTNGAPVCPKCSSERIYPVKSRRGFMCAECACSFTPTTNTIFHSRKLPYRKLLGAIINFAQAVKGMSALQMSRSLGVSYKTAFVLLHKMREAIDHTRREIILDGEVEMDGVYVGQRARPANIGKLGVRIYPAHRTKKCVLTMTQRGGPTVARVIQSETQEAVLSAAHAHIRQSATIYADENGAYDALYAYYQVKRINHSRAYANGRIHTNKAESIHSRFRRAQYGQYHRISGRHLQSYAAEIAYRNDRSKTSDGAIFKDIGLMCASHPISRIWKGQWQKRPPPDPVAA
jgi:transposase-like protein